MRFSLRTLFALTFLVVLAMLAWRSWHAAQRQAVRFNQLQRELETLQAGLRVDDPALHQAILNAEDEFSSMRAMAQRATRQFEVLRERYSGIEPVGPAVLSVRTLPSLQTRASVEPTAFAVRVPDEREVWLKFGVHAGEGSRHSNVGDPELAYDLLTESPFSHSGPYAMRLPAGYQTLTITRGPASDGELPVAIRLDDRVVLRSVYVADAPRSRGASWIAANAQRDLGPDQPIQWLLTAQVDGEPSTEVDPTAEAGAGPSHRFTVWLSDRSSGFSAFPDAGPRE